MKTTHFRYLLILSFFFGCSENKIQKIEEKSQFVRESNVIGDSPKDDVDAQRLDVEEITEDIPSELEILDAECAALVPPGKFDQDLAQCVLVADSIECKALGDPYKYLEVGPEREYCENVAGKCPDNFREDIEDVSRCIAMTGHSRRNPGSSCKQILDHGYAADRGSGNYWLDIYGDGSITVEAYCDMVTAGGGWTLVMKYNRDLATTEAYSMHLNAGRGFQAVADLVTLNAIPSSKLSASFDIRPLIQRGGNYFMHAAKGLEGDDANPVYAAVFFNEIYQDVMLNPDSLFDPTLDTNLTNACRVDSIPVIEEANATSRNRWFNSLYQELVTDLSGDVVPRNFFIKGGAGSAMWTNACRNGSMFSSHTFRLDINDVNGVYGHNNPNVQWSFLGQDGSKPDYLSPIAVPKVGTCMYDPLVAQTCPENPINLLFIKSSETFPF